MYSTNLHTSFQDFRGGLMERKPDLKADKPGCWALQMIRMMVQMVWGPIDPKDSWALIL
jgi:hypothetical protein